MSHEKITSKVSKKVTKKVQGSNTATGARGRSVGSEYAYAVEGAMQNAKKIRKQAQSSFLGKSKKTLKSDSLVKSDKLTGTKKSKARSKKVK